MRRVCAQADKRQSQNHGRPRTETKDQRPDYRLSRPEPQPAGADGAHQRHNDRDGALVFKAMKNQRNRQPGGRGGQLEQTMQRARLRFAVAKALQNGRQPANNNVIDQRVDAEEQRDLPGERGAPDSAIVHGAGTGERRSRGLARLR